MIAESDQLTPSEKRACIYTVALDLYGDIALLIHDKKETWKDEPAETFEVHAMTRPLLVTLGIMKDCYDCSILLKDDYSLVEQWEDRARTQFENQIQITKAYLNNIRKLQSENGTFQGLPDITH